MYCALPLVASEVNLIRNADFSEGILHYGVSDKMPELLDFKIAQDDVVGKYITYNSEKNALGGLNLSEIYVGDAKQLKVSFFAKADKPLKIRLIAMANGNSIYRRQIKDFSIGTNWKEYSTTIDLTKLPEGHIDRWIPFRFEKVSSKPNKIVETQEAKLCFSKIKAVALNATEKQNSGIIDTTVLIEPLKKKGNFFKRWYNKFAKKNSTEIRPYNVFSKDENLNIKINFSNNKALEKKLSYEIIDNDTTETLPQISSEPRLIDIPKGTSTINIEENCIVKNGIYTLLIKLDGVVVCKSNFTITPRVRAPRGVLPIDLGYCGVITDGESAAPTPEEMAFLADSGIAFIRTWDSGNPFNWRVLEPEEGKFFWDITDETVRLASENNLEVLPVLGGMFFIYPPHMGLRGHRQADWLYAKAEVVRPILGMEKQGRKAIKPSMADWNRMVTAVGKRYKGKIKHYEIMNEPNIIWHDPMTYYPYLESSNKILKGIDPNNKIVGFSTTGDYGGNPNGFLAKLLKSGAGKFSDIISFHSYSSLFEDSRKPSDKLIEDFKESLAKNGVNNQPLWHTELYYMNPTSRLGGADHANGPIFHPGYLIRRYLVDAANGVEADILLPARTISIRYKSAGVSTENFAQGRHLPYSSVGKYNNKYIPNKRYIVSAVFADKLKHTKFSKKHYLDDKILAYEFADKKSDKVVVALFWLDSYMENLNRSRDPKTKVIDKLNRAPKNIGRLPKGIEISDVFGNELPQTGCADETVLEVSPIPIYITAENTKQMEQFLNKLRTKK